MPANRDTRCVANLCHQSPRTHSVHPLAALNRLQMSFTYNYLIFPTHCEGLLDDSIHCKPIFRTVCFLPFSFSVFKCVHGSKKFLHGPMVQLYGSATFCTGPTIRIVSTKSTCVHTCISSTHFTSFTSLHSSYFFMIRIMESSRVLYVSYAGKTYLRHHRH